MTGRGKGAGFPLRVGLANEAGFTMVELVIVIALIAIIIIIAGLELGKTSTISRMNKAVVQVGRALEDAYSIAQNERVKVTVHFELGSNWYTVSRAGESAMEPPLGIRHPVDNQIMLLDSGTQPVFSEESAGTVIFQPMGSATKSVEGSTPVAERKITLSYPGLSDESITVNAEGEVSSP